MRLTVLIGLAGLVWFQRPALQDYLAPSPPFTPLPRPQNQPPPLTVTDSVLFVNASPSSTGSGLAFAVGYPPVLLTVTSAVPGARPGDRVAVSRLDGTTTQALVRAIAPKQGLVALSCDVDCGVPALTTGSALVTRPGAPVYIYNISNAYPVMGIRLGRLFRTKDNLLYHLSVPVGSVTRGGPLLDHEGRVLGVLTDLHDLANPGGLAVPIELVSSGSIPELAGVTELGDAGDHVELKRGWARAAPLPQAKRPAPTKTSPPQTASPQRRSSIKGGLSVVRSSRTHYGIHLKVRLTLPTNTKITPIAWRLEHSRQGSEELTGFEKLMAREDSRLGTTTYTLQYFGKSSKAHGPDWRLSRGKLTSGPFVFEKAKKPVADILEQRFKAPPTRRPWW